MNPDDFDKLFRINREFSRISSMHDLASSAAIFANKDFGIAQISTRQIRDLFATKINTDIFQINRLADESIWKLANPFSNIGSSLAHEIASKHSVFIRDALRINSMREAIVSHSDIYNLQLKISEGLSRNFTSLTSLKSLSSEIFKSTNFIENKKLSAFDVISGSSFLKTLDNYNDDETLSEAYSEVESLLAENTDLKEEITKLQATIAVIQGGNQNHINTEEWYKIKGITHYLEWFMNKVLIRKFGIAPAYANLLVVISIISMTAMYDITNEAKGDDIYNGITGNKIEVRTDSSLKSYLDNILKLSQSPDEITDFPIEKTPIYLRKSRKTKKVGILNAGTDIRIIKIDSGWCFIEGIATVRKNNNRKNRKKYHSKKESIFFEEKIRGWVEKKHLDMFQ